MALTHKQLLWARRVYTVNGYLRCHFPIYSERKGWIICGSTDSVQIHHCKPQGWVRRILGSNPDYPENLIAICAFHHVGRGYGGSLDWHNSVVSVIHPDMVWALRRYKKDPTSFDTVFAGRIQQTAKNQTYWNTDFDEALEDIAQRIVHKYLLEHPKDPFPERKR